MPRIETWHFDVTELDSDIHMGKDWDTMSDDCDGELPGPLARAAANKLIGEHEQRTGMDLVPVNWRLLPSDADTEWTPEDDKH